MSYIRFDRVQASNRWRPLELHNTKFCLANHERYHSSNTIVVGRKKVEYLYKRVIIAFTIPPHIKWPWCIFGKSHLQTQLVYLLYDLKSDRCKMSVWTNTYAQLPKFNVIPQKPPVSWTSWHFIWLTTISRLLMVYWGIVRFSDLRFKSIQHYVIYSDSLYGNFLLNVWCITEDPCSTWIKCSVRGLLDL